MFDSPLEGPIFPQRFYSNLWANRTPCVKDAYCIRLAASHCHIPHSDKLCGWNQQVGQIGRLDTCSRHTMTWHRWYKRIEKTLSRWHRWLRKYVVHKISTNFTWLWGPIPLLGGKAPQSVVIASNQGMPVLASQHIFIRAWGKNGRKNYTWNQPGWLKCKNQIAPNKKRSFGGNSMVGSEARWQHRRMYYRSRPNMSKIWR